MTMPVVSGGMMGTTIPAPRPARPELARHTAMVVAPHYLAAEAGCEVLRDGGNAIEAMVSAAATIAVVYPHMNGIGGDAFWLIAEPGAEPVAIDGAGRAAADACPNRFRAAFGGRMPTRGPMAALTIPCAVATWRAALDISARRSTPIPLDRLLGPAIQHARTGHPVSNSQWSATATKLEELRNVPGFASHYLMQGAPPPPGTRLAAPQLAATLAHLAQAGLDDFYRGEVGAALSADLADAGTVLTGRDLRRGRADVVGPLSLRLREGVAFNLGAPTQGLVSLIILGIFERVAARVSLAPEDRVHVLVEATKLAFEVRDRAIADPARVPCDLQAFLDPALLDVMAAGVRLDAALPWRPAAPPADTVWMGAIDSDGLAVSFIQSIFWEYGSGVVSPRTGVLLQNRGAAFSLEPGHLNELRPHAKPFHTLNPALLRFNDGRTMVYGAMGGEGQPQFQSAVLTAYTHLGLDVADAVAAPRWLLGRTWGAESTALHVESDMDERIIAHLRGLDHPVALASPASEMLGHAGAIVRNSDGAVTGASDPRSDGSAAGCRPA